MKINTIINYINEHLELVKTLDHFKDYLNEMNIKIDDIEESKIQFDSNKYRRNIIFRNDTFEILLICWEEGQSTPIHFHPEKGCLLNVIQGELEETIYNKSNEIEKQNHFKINNISYMHNTIGSHSIRNIYKGRSISLHIYSPPNFYN